MIISFIVKCPVRTTPARWFGLGVETVVLKCGAKGAMIYQPEKEGQRAAPTLCERPVDTTGAGDSFNAGFIAAKCKGISNEEAALAGNQLASHVIRYSGAIIPAADMPNVFKQKTSYSLMYEVKVSLLIRLRGGKWFNCDFRRQILR